jgi:hypothetical protein
VCSAAACVAEWDWTAEQPHCDEREKDCLLQPATERRKKREKERKKEKEKENEKERERKRMRKRER